MAEYPSDETLRLVANHGSGKLERSLAIVQLAKRSGRVEELKKIAETADRSR